MRICEDVCKHQTARRQAGLLELLGQRLAVGGGAVVQGATEMWQSLLRPRADEGRWPILLTPEGPARRRSQRPPPSLTWGGLSAPRVATATAAAPTRAGTTCAAEQAYARSIAAARSDARKGAQRARIEGATRKGEKNSRRDACCARRWRGERQSRVPLARVRSPAQEACGAEDLTGHASWPSGLLAVTSHS